MVGLIERLGAEQSDPRMSIHAHVPHGGQWMSEIARRFGQRDGGGVHRVGYKAWKPQRWESHHSLIEN